MSERETQFWLDVLRQATTTLGEHAPDTLPWFQLDRGGDAAQVLSAAASLGVGWHLLELCLNQWTAPGGIADRSS